MVSSERALGSVRNFGNDTLLSEHPDLYRSKEWKRKLRITPCGTGRNFSLLLWEKRAGNVWYIAKCILARIAIQWLAEPNYSKSEGRWDNNGILCSVKAYGIPPVVHIPMWCDWLQCKWVPRFVFSFLVARYPFLVCELRFVQHFSFRVAFSFLPWLTPAIRRMLSLLNWVSL